MMLALLFGRRMFSPLRRREKSLILISCSVLQVAQERIQIRMADCCTVL